MDILDIFLQLHYLDGRETPPPMNMTLLTKARFSQRLDYLLRCVSEGKGVSQLEVEGSTVDTISPERAHDPGGTADFGATDELPADRDYSEHAPSHEDTVAHLQAQEPVKNDDRSSAEELLTIDQSTIIENPKTKDAAESTDNSKLENELAAASNSNSSAIPTAIQPDNVAAASPPQALNEFSEDQYDGGEGEGEEKVSDDEDAYTDEDAYHNDNACPDDQDSADSSTVQGDDALEMKHDVDISSEANNFDGKPEPDQQKLTSRSADHLDDEDLITYESNEEGGVDNVNGSETDSRWQDTEEVNLENPEVVVSTPVASFSPEAALSHHMVHTDENGHKDSSSQDPSALTSDQNEAAIYHFETSQAGFGLNVGDAKSHEQAWNPAVSESHEEDGAYDSDSSNNVRQDMGPGHEQHPLHGLTPAEAKDLGPSWQRSAPSADDEDEITLMTRSRKQQQQRIPSPVPLGLPPNKLLTQALAC